MITREKTHAPRVWRFCFTCLTVLGVMWSTAAQSEPDSSCRSAGSVPEYVLWVGGNAPGRAVREVAAIKAALEQTQESFGPYRLTVSRDSHADNSWRRALALGEQMHIVPTSYLNFPPGELTLIPVPIAGGKLGYRHLVVRRERLGDFTAVEHAGDLRDKIAGQGKYWPDMWVYEANNLPVKGMRDLPTLLDALVRGDIDYLPLGVDESESILASYAGDSQSLAVVPGVLIYYPLSSSPVVTNRCPELIARLSEGLEAMHAQGLLRAIPAEQFVPPQSRLIKLENPTRLFPVAH